MKIKILLSIAFIYLFNIKIVSAQSAKRFFADAKASEQANNLEEAIDYYTKAISIDAKYYEAIIERAKCHEKINKLDEAIEGYKSAATIKPTEIESYEKIGSLYIKKKMYSDAISSFKQVIDIKKKYAIAYQQIAFCYMNTQEFKKAIAECDKAIEIDKSSSTSYLYKAMSNDSLNNTKDAFDNYTFALSALEKSEEFKKSLNKEVYYHYYLGMGNAQLKNNFIDLAIENYSKSIAFNKQAYDSYAMRGKAFSMKMKLKEAEIDYNQSIVINDKNSNSFAGRAYVYFRIGEYEKAISDYERAIAIDKTNASAYKGKGQCLEALNKIEDAKINYEYALKYAKLHKEQDLEVYENLFKNISTKLFQAKREANAPSIYIDNADNNKLNLIVAKNKTKATLTGKVTDESKIDKILIGDVDVSFDKEMSNPKFSVDINLFMKDEVEVLVQDVYGNELKSYYKIVRAEKDAPKIIIESPVAIAGNNFELNDSIKYKLKITGKIEDESAIKSIIINGKSASFDSKTVNPNFTISLDIVGIDSVRIIVVDDFDNQSTTAYLLKRAGIKNSEISPMGKTWVVFIDNSKYTQLPLLEASSNDVLSMKSALQSYNIENVIVKNDMTKPQMEKFFSIELRDLVNANNVNSIMIFYAGHGKFINENGYWLPVDANKKDEFTFFNVASLKNYLGTYKPLVHSLVVSDACETGPAFYLAMRDVNKMPECGQWEAARKKSAQVLTSTTIDLNDDKSIFTKSFVAALKSCNDKCISIEKIADKISKQSVQNQKPKPKLGIIPTLNNDDDATFFFVKK